MLDFLDGFDWVKETMESHANFILFRVEDAGALVDWCADRGIRIRNFDSQAQLRGCVRLTIGSQTEMEAVKSALRAFGEQL